MIGNALLSLKDAAEAVGLTKPALFKAIKAGRLSATKDDRNQWHIDPAELFRAYPQAKTNTETKSETSLQQEIDSLRRELHQRDERISDLRENLNDLKTDRDQWRQQATNLLTHQPAAAPVPDQGKLEPDKGSYLSWFARLTRKPTT
jgi:TolA-binding protein